jgi:hypothetical protein
MAYFQTKNPIWVNLGGSINGKRRCGSWPFGLFYGHLVYFVAIPYILRLFGTLFTRFGMLSQEKSGNPDFQKCLGAKSLEKRANLWLLCQGPAKIWDRCYSFKIFDFF